MVIRVGIASDIDTATGIDLVKTSTALGSLVLDRLVCIGSETGVEGAPWLSIDRVAQGRSNILTLVEEGQTISSGVAQMDRSNGTDRASGSDMTSVDSSGTGQEGYDSSDPGDLDGNHGDSECYL